MRSVNSCKGNWGNFFIPCYKINSVYSFPRLFVDYLFLFLKYISECLIFIYQLFVASSFLFLNNFRKKRKKEILCEKLSPLSTHSEIQALHGDFPYTHTYKKTRRIALGEKSQSYYIILCLSGHCHTCRRTHIHAPFPFYIETESFSHYIALLIFFGFVFHIFLVFHAYIKLEDMYFFIYLLFFFVVA